VGSIDKRERHRCRIVHRRHHQSRWHSPAQCAQRAGNIERDDYADVDQCQQLAKNDSRNVEAGDGRASTRRRKSCCPISAAGAAQSPALTSRTPLHRRSFSPDSLAFSNRANHRESSRPPRGVNRSQIRESPTSERRGDFPSGQPPRSGLSRALRLANTDLGQAHDLEQLMTVKIDAMVGEVPQTSGPGRLRSDARMRSPMIGSRGPEF
jgi:hypothetical protein